MADPELEEIKRARLAELQQGGAQGDQGAQRKQVEAERRSLIVNQILEPKAVDRLNRIRLVKESRAVDIENRLIMLAQSGQVRQVSEEQLKGLLNAMAENERKGEEEQKVVVNRRKGGWDDDDLLSGL